MADIKWVQETLFDREDFSRPGLPEPLDTEDHDG